MLARSAALASSVVVLACASSARVEPIAAKPTRPVEVRAEPNTAEIASPAPTANEALRAEPEAPPPAPSVPAPPLESPRRFQQPMPDKTLPASAPGMRLANLAPGACRAEARRRKLAAAPARKTRGVATPMRLTGPLQGVRYAGPGSKSTSGVLDCRLVLALDELAPVLEELGVATVHIGGFYRSRAHLPGKKVPSQHARGLAMDVIGFTLEDGTRLEIERDWGGTIGEPACGPDAAPSAPSASTVLLRDVVCGLARAGIFHHVLTPGFDAAHRSHLHIDLKRGSNLGVVR